MWRGGGAPVRAVPERIARSSSGRGERDALSGVVPRGARGDEPALRGAPARAGSAAGDPVEARRPTGLDPPALAARPRAARPARPRRRTSPRCGATSRSSTSSRATPPMADLWHVARGGPGRTGSATREVARAVARGRPRRRRPRRRDGWRAARVALAGGRRGRRRPGRRGARRPRSRHPGRVAGVARRRARREPRRSPSFADFARLRAPVAAAPHDIARLHYELRLYADRRRGRSARLLRRHRRPHHRRPRAGGGDTSPTCATPFASAAIHQDRDAGAHARRGRSSSGSGRVVARRRIGARCSWPASPRPPRSDGRACASRV